MIPPDGNVPDLLRHRIEVGEGETLDLAVFMLPGVSASVHIDVEITGKDAAVDLSGLFFCTGNDKVDVKTDVVHRCGGSSSRQTFLGAAAGSAETLFSGKIVVCPDAQGTEAYQENHNLLLSKEASMGTDPQLEIYADDVRCSHGATVGRLSEEELFYMRSRGIPESEAKVLQIVSFFSKVIAALPDGEREEIAARVEEAARKYV